MRQNIIRKIRPLTAGQRHKSYFSPLRENVDSKKNSTRRDKSLTRSISRSFGINNQGKRTARNIFSGSIKRKYRVIDFQRKEFGIEGKIISREYDPNRNADIALVLYRNGKRKYILLPDNKGINEKIISYKGEPSNSLNIGDSSELRYIPIGIPIHNIQFKPGAESGAVRSAGTFAVILRKDDSYAEIKFPSKEVRRIPLSCSATIGRVGNIEIAQQSLGKAGRSYYLGIRPHTRGSAMNPVDHPLGGGKGRGHGRTPVNRTGTVKKGQRTRDKNRYSSPFIVSRRPSRKER